MDEIPGLLVDEHHPTIVDALTWLDCLEERCEHASPADCPTRPEMVCGTCGELSECGDLCFQALWPCQYAEGERE